LFEAGDACLGLTAVRDLHAVQDSGQAVFAGGEKPTPEQAAVTIAASPRPAGAQKDPF